MQPIRKSQTGVGTTDWIPMDIHRDPFNAGFGVVVDGTATYSVEHTFWPNIFTDATVPADEVFPHETITAQTDNADGNYAFPVTAVRLNVTAGDGTAELTIIQAGIRGG